jgi:iron(III) transport system permease protein
VLGRRIGYPSAQMGGLRVVRRSSFAVQILRLVPWIALVLAAVLDRGPQGETRFSAHFLPVVLWVYDDFAWTCARNSVVFAGVVTLISLGMGVTAAWLGARRQFWGQALGRGWVESILAVSPAFVALGLVGLWGQPQSWPWPFSGPRATERGVSLESWSGLPLWMTWIWSTLPAAIALVTVITRPAVERLSTSWDDAARIAGGAGPGVWRRLTWPLIRPAAARGAALVFFLSLIEPGAPRILGLRRTLAFQIVELASRPEPFPRLAVWALIAALIAVAGSVLIRWWGGPAKIGNGDESIRTVAPRPATPGGALCSWLFLGGVGVVGWLPIVGLFELSVGPAWRHSASNGEASRVPATLAHCFGGAPVPDLMAASALLGAEVAAGLALLGWLLRADGSGRSPPALLPRLRVGMPAIPPLSLGIGVLALPWLASLAAHSLFDDGWIGWLARGLERLRIWLDPDRNAWALLALGVGLALAPWFLAAAASSRDRAQHHWVDSRVEAALLAGASRGRARRLARAGGLNRWLVCVFAVWAAAATNLTPALLWAPWSDGRTVAAGAVVLAGGAAEDECQAAALALLAIVVTLAALLLVRVTNSLRPFDELD